ncbi:MAG: hypothetical protein F6K42_38005 [Leptolyngbya sp. SIO1D8]|nr:hypothetical protein [Leptolyngbya sp. SIO1D8]
MLLCWGLVACGLSQKAQCESVLEGVFATENEFELGTQTKAILLTNASLYGELAADLEKIELSDKSIRQTVDDLAAAYEDHAAALEATAEVTTAEGTIRGEETYRKVQAQEMRAMNNIQLHTEKLMGACR